MPGFLATNNKDLFDLYDMIGARYKILPSDVAKLDWKDLLITIQSIKTRSTRLKKIMKRSRSKKGMIIPNISISELADLM